MAYEQVWGAETSYKLACLRTFRDDVLSKSAPGRQYVERIYANSVEIALLLLRDRALCGRLRQTVDLLVPAIRERIAGGTALLLPAQVDALKGLCLAAESAAISRNMRELAREALVDLSDEQMLREMGFLVR